MLGWPKAKTNVSNRTMKSFQQVLRMAGSPAGLEHGCPSSHHVRPLPTAIIPATPPSLAGYDRNTSSNININNIYKYILYIL